MRVRVRLVALVGLLALVGSACGAAASVTPEPAGLAHFVSAGDGVSFDYPAAWRLIAADQAGDLVHRTIAVVGTGTWSGAGCTAFGNSASCKDGVPSVGAGQIVVRVYRDHQAGPAMMCDPSSTANATLGTVVARETGSPTGRIWEVRDPNTPYFGAQNNLWVEARTDDPAQMAKAEALVASLKQADSGTGVDCWWPDTSSEQSPASTSSATASAFTASPASAGPALGRFEPSLDVAEPMNTTGGAAMHESLGSASDGVVFVKDYGRSAGGGNNVYRVTLYRSFDGITWQAVDVPVPSDQQESQVACRGWNCVLLTEFPQNGAMSVTDDGRHWQSVAGAPKFGQATITAGASGFVITGWELGSGKNRAVFSTNGRDWHDLRFVGAHPLIGGNPFTDPAAGWFMVAAYLTGSQGHPVMTVSKDGSTWDEVPDPGGLYQTADLVRQTAFHFAGRWYVAASYRQMPPGYSAGGFGMAASTSTPVATWSTIYWIADGSLVLHSSGRITAALPDQVATMDGYLVGARANADFTTSLLLSTDAEHWTEQGLLPPGVPEPSSLHGMSVYFEPTIRRAGPNVVMQGDALKPNEMGCGLYVAKPVK